jgi:hypothetical protein
MGGRGSSSGGWPDTVKAFNQKQEEKQGKLDITDGGESAGNSSSEPIQMPAQLPTGVTQEILIQSASTPDKAHVTSIGRAFQKHIAPKRAGTFTGKQTGSTAFNTQQGLSVLQDILDNTGWINIKSHPQLGGMIDIHKADGTGARWSADGKKFIGFLEKTTTKPIPERCKMDLWSADFVYSADDDFVSVDIYYKEAEVAAIITYNGKETMTTLFMQDSDIQIPDDWLAALAQELKEKIMDNYSDLPGVLPISKICQQLSLCGDLQIIIQAVV